MPDRPDEFVEDVIRADGRYPLEAFAFLHEGLERAAKEAHAGSGKMPEPGSRHVTGRQMCLAIRDLAIERWGMLAPTVLGKWNIHATIDFGEMVYLEIEHKFMFKTEEDSIEDFRNVYDFAEAFGDVDTFEIRP